MDIKRNGSQASAKGRDDWFTGAVRIDGPFQASAPARVSGASVTFEPGARTAWHTHPLGQTLIVTSGCGWVQREGGPVEEVRPGDIVWFLPGEKHWHGATPTTAMSHIAIAEALDGKAVEWMEHVTDQQYRAGPDKADIEIEEKTHAKAQARKERIRSFGNRAGLHGPELRLWSSSR